MTLSTLTFTVILSQGSSRVCVNLPHVDPALPDDVVPGARNLVKVPVPLLLKRQKNFRILFPLFGNFFPDGINISINITKD